MRGLAGRLVSCALFLLVAITAANAEMKPLNPFAAEVAPAETAPRCASFGLQSRHSAGAIAGFLRWDLRMGVAHPAEPTTRPRHQREKPQRRTRHGRRVHARGALLHLWRGACRWTGSRQDDHLLLRGRQRGDGAPRRDHLLHCRSAAGADGHRAGRRPCLRAERLGHADQCLVEPARDGELRADRAGRRLAADDATHRHLPALARVARGRSAC